MLWGEGCLSFKWSTPFGHTKTPPTRKCWRTLLENLAYCCFPSKRESRNICQVHSLFSTPACGTLARPGACVLEGSTFRTGLLTFWSWFMQMNSQIVAREKCLEGFIFFRWPGLALCSPDPELSRTELQGLQRSVPGQWMPSHPWLLVVWPEIPYTSRLTPFSWAPAAWGQDAKHSAP